MQIVPHTIFLQKLKESKEISLSFKFDDRLRRIILLAFSNERQKKFACQFQNYEDASLYCLIFETILSIEKIYLYDLKMFLKLFFYYNSDYIYNIQLESFTDLLIELYDKFNKHITLCDDFIEKLISKKVQKEHLTEFYNKISETYYLPYQIIPLENILKECLQELQILDLIKNTIKIEENEFKNSIYRSIETYSYIENNRIYLNNNIEKIEKYFDNVDFHKQVIGDISYNFTKTRTGRLESKFHLISKENQNKILTSRFENGKILFCDMKNFEIRSMMKMWNIKCHEEDVYFIDKFEREVVKKSVISWLYGAVSYNKKVIEKFIEKYPQIKLEKLYYENNLESCLITTMGKYIEYDSNDEYKRKCVNYLVQNYATYLILDFTTNLNKILITKKCDSKILATKFDEIILDCKSEELDFVYKAIDFCLKKISDDITFSATTHFGEID